MLSLAALLLLPLVLAEEKPDSKLINEGIQKVLECAGEGNVNYGLCMEMMKPEAKLDDEKYQPCKCLIPCVSKKMNVMSEDGKFKEPEILKIVNDLQTPGYKEEGLRVYEMCKAVEGTECVGGFNMVSCVLKNSEKARDIVKQLMGSLEGGSA